MQLLRNCSKVPELFEISPWSVLPAWSRNDCSYRNCFFLNLAPTSGSGCSPSAFQMKHRHPAFSKGSEKNFYTYSCTWRWRRKARSGPKKSNFEGTTKIWKCSPLFFHKWWHWARKLINENRTMIELKNTVIRPVQTANWVTGTSFWMASWSINWLMD